MILLSVLSILLLVINPVLLGLFRWMGVSIQKFQFWVLVTSGISWAASLAAYLLKPDQTLNLFWDVGSELLPGSIITLDQVSSSLILILTSLVFASALDQDYSPRQHAWISGLGAVCSLGLLADSPFTLLVALVMVEGVLILDAIFNIQEGLRLRLLGAAARLLTPVLVLYAALLSGTQSTLASFEALVPASAPILLAAGLICLLGWTKLLAAPGPNPEGQLPRLFAELLPGSLGLMLLVRAGSLLAGDLPISAGLVMGAVSLIFAISGFILALPRLGWNLSVPWLVITAAWAGMPGASLIWCAVFLLAGYLLVDPRQTRSQNLLLLAAGALGVVALPFLPAWSGASVFTTGLSGYLLAAAFGIAAGALLGRRLSRLLKNSFSPDPLAVTSAVGAGCLILTLFLISLSSGLVPASISLGGYPLAVWTPLPFLAAALLLRVRIPAKNYLPVSLADESRESPALSLLALARNTIDRVIAVLTGLFEGEGGLIWALLIAFLLLTLIGRLEG